MNENKIKKTGCIILLILYTAVMLTFILLVRHAIRVNTAPELESIYENNILETNTIKIGVKAKNDYRFVKLIIEIYDNKNRIINTVYVTEYDLKDDQTYIFTYNLSIAEIENGHHYEATIEKYRIKY